MDLDVDIGAEAVDYKYVLMFFVTQDIVFTSSFSAIANQESLSGLETEMRKLEGMVKEVSEDMEFLDRREERFTRTNSACCFPIDIVSHN